MKKSTEKKRVKRMGADAKQLFLHGLISASSLDKINSALKAAFKKL